MVIVGCTAARERQNSDRERPSLTKVSNFFVVVLRSPFDRCERLVARAFVARDYNK